MAPLQILATLNGRTLCADPAHGPGLAARDLLERVAAWSGVPASELELERGAKEGGGVVPWGSAVRVRLRGGLRGGKGGFGAALRASKGKGRQTTDFGACRDLQGRRLRHVNNELRLRAWREEQQERREAAEKGKVWDPRSSKLRNTESGIANWFLQTPTWAKVGNPGKRDAKSSAPPKVELCLKWQQARERGAPPEGAPAWWGCPRGRACLFAHGREELAPEGKSRLAKQQRETRKQAETAVLQDHTQEVQRIKRSLQESIQQGLDRSRVEAASAAAAPLLENDASYVRCICGDVAVGETGEAEGLSAFASACVPSVAVSSGRWYFELELLEGEAPLGAIQAGVASGAFEPDEATNDGVGDKPGSWAFDPVRNVVFFDGREESVGQPPGERPRFVGCAMDLDARTLAFFVDGSKVEGAKEAPTLPVGGMVFPAVSLEQGQAVRFNLGERPFAHRPPAGFEGLSGPGVGPAATAAAAGAGAVMGEEPSKKPVVAARNSPTDVDTCESALELAALGMDRLKAELQRRGLKCGGTLEERAARLLAVRGVAPEDYDPSLVPVAKKKARTR